MLSGKGFSDMCTWVIDHRYPSRPVFSYSHSRDGDWVFINGDYLHAFFNLLPFVTTKRFFVIVHNSDKTFTHYQMERLRKYVHRVYAINTNFLHQRLTTIPIGFVDKQIGFLENYTRKTVKRDIEVYMNFTSRTNSVARDRCMYAFENDPRVTVRENLSLDEYYEDLCRSKFVLCPEGTGMDTHRVYEALFCGATPVVLRNSLSHLYEKLPVCILDRWTDPFYVPHRRDIRWDCQFFLT